MLNRHKFSGNITFSTNTVTFLGLARILHLCKNTLLFSKGCYDLAWPPTNTKNLSKNSHKNFSPSPLSLLNHLLKLLFYLYVTIILSFVCRPHATIIFVLYVCVHCSNNSSLYPWWDCVINSKLKAAVMAISLDPQSSSQCSKCTQSNTPPIVHRFCNRSFHRIISQFIVNYIDIFNM